MISIFKRFSLTRLAHVGGVMLSALAMGACGGNAEFPAPATEAGTPSAPTLRINLTDASGTAKTLVTTGNPLFAKARLLDAGGAPMKNQIVTFTVSSTLATLSPSSGTALTDDSGIAQVDILSAGLGAGAAEISASAFAGTATVTAKAAFAIGAPTTAAGNGAMWLVLTDSSGAAKNTVTTSSPLLAKATVTDDSGKPLPNKIVTFSVNASMVAIAPAAGTALTDSNGVAQVSIQASGLGGAGEVTASVTVGSDPVTAKAAFSAGADPSATPVAINFVSAVPADRSIVIKGAGGNGRTEVALVTFSVVDSSNTGVANVPITFSTSQAVTLASTTGITDRDGRVTVALNSGTTPTSVRVVATVTGTSISSLSDQVTVTTGQPAQASFSLSMPKYYIEGLNYDNTQINVLALLADAYGGAVADGTQIIFTADTGAIVGTGGARCLTVDGACSVTWRSQNPRPAGGVGTITATATNSSAAVLSATTKFYDSGSYAIVSLVPGTAGITQSALSSPINLSFLTSCDSQAFEIKIFDVNNNPLPEGTTVSAVNASNASAVVAPSSVQQTGRAIVAGTDATTHGVAITPSGCDLAGTKTLTGVIDISVKTPLGNETFTRVNLGAFKGN